MSGDDLVRDAVTREARIAETFVRLADTLVDDYDVIEFLSLLTERCVELVDADAAAIMLVDPGGTMQAVASSSERSMLLELFELQSLDGPCLDAFRTGTTVASEDLRNDLERWPAFAPRAVNDGFLAVHSVPLQLRNEAVGALNLLRISPGTLPDVDATLALAMADVATIGLLNQRALAESKHLADSLRLALISRVRIEQAKGVIAERHGVEVDGAFDVIRTHARQTRRRLSELAEAIVVDGYDLPSS